MHPHAHRRRRSWWPLALAATLALAPGCSSEPEPQDVLVPIWDSRHIVTYQYVPRNQLAAESPAEASSATRSNDWLRKELAEAEDRRRQAILAEQEMRREREAQWRRQLQEEEASREAWWQGVRERRLRERQQRVAYQQQLSRWLEDRRLRGQAEAEAWRRAAQPLDLLHLQNPR